MNQRVYRFSWVLVFWKNKRERIPSLKIIILKIVIQKVFQLMNQIFSDFLFIVLIIFSSFFGGTREKGVSIKEGLRPREPNIYRFSFYFGLFIFSLFFFENNWERIISLKTII